MDTYNRRSPDKFRVFSYKWSIMFKGVCKEKGFYCRCIGCENKECNFKYCNLDKCPVGACINHSEYKRKDGSDKSS